MLYRMSDTKEVISNEDMAISGEVTMGGIVGSQREGEWKTYVNIDYDFAFDYPKEWTIEFYDAQQNSKILSAVEDIESGGSHAISFFIEEPRNKEMLLEDLNANLTATDEIHTTYGEPVALTVNGVELISQSYIPYEIAPTGIHYYIPDSNLSFIVTDLYDNYGEGNEELNREYHNTVLSDLTFTLNADLIELGEEQRAVTQIEKKEWGIRLEKDPSWSTVYNHSGGVKFARYVVDGGLGDEITITPKFGKTVTTEDAKFGSTTFRYDEEVGKWMREGKYNEIEDVEEPEWVEADIQETDNDIRYATSTGRWLTYVVFLDNDETLIVNISGSGETEPLTTLLNSMSTF